MESPKTGRLGDRPKAAHGLGYRSLSLVLYRTELDSLSGTGRKPTRNRIHGRAYNLR